MTVSELIKKLSELDQDKQVELLFEGINMDTDYVFEAKNKNILICAHEELDSAYGHNVPLKPIKSIFE